MLRRKFDVNRLQDRLARIDCKLVQILQMNGRKPTAAIARELNVSRTAVQARIARLEKDGVIVGYALEIAPHAGGNVAAIVTLKFNVHPCSLALAVVLLWPGVLRVLFVAGEADAILVVSVVTLQPLAELSDWLLAIDGRCAAETNITLAEYHSYRLRAGLTLACCDYGRLVSLASRLSGSDFLALHGGTKFRRELPARRKFVPVSRPQFRPVSNNVVR